MKTLTLVAGVMAAIVTLTGCQATKSLLSNRDNGSLDYRNAAKLPPLKLPADQPTADFTPLYQAPNGTGQLTDFVNEAGKQYQLPRPPSVR